MTDITEIKENMEKQINGEFSDSSKIGFVKFLKLNYAKRMERIVDAPF